MARPKIAAGEVGQVQVTQLASGKWRARARMRDDSGELVQLRAEGATEADAREELLSRAKTLTTHTKSIVTSGSTIAEAAEAWLPTVKVRAENGTLSWSTYENYETTVRLTLVPVCGGVTLEALTVGRCDRIIQNLLADRGVSSARKARSVLSLICGFAVRDDAIPTNPVRDVTRLPTPEKKTAMLTPQQIEAIRDLMTRWRETEGMGPRPHWRALVDGMDIMLGTSARVGECIGLRRCDVDMTTAPPTILIDGTVIQNKAQGIQRKNAPKRTRQPRRVALPALAADAVRRRLALAEKGLEALLFPTKTGKPMSCRTTSVYCARSSTTTVMSSCVSVLTWMSTRRTSTGAPPRLSWSARRGSRSRHGCSGMRTRRSHATATSSRPSKLMSSPPTSSTRSLGHES